MFGKLMSISDELMWSYYELLTDFPPPVIVRLREEVRTGCSTRWMRRCSWRTR